MPDPPAIPSGSIEDETQVLSPTAAHRAWSSPELRSMIIDHMAKKDIVKVLCLDQTAFTGMVKSMYRCFHFQDYDRLLSPIIPYTRRKLYIKSIRELDLEGATPLLHGINGYSHLLDLFPLVNRITACGVELVTPSRQMGNDGSPASTATFYIKYIIDAAYPYVPPDAYSVVLRAFPNCQYIYDVEVESALNVDWEVLPWDLAAAPEEHSSLDSSLESRARKTLDDIRIRFDGDLRMAAILCRQIRSIMLDMGDGEEEDFTLLSNHLKRRRQAGYDDIPKIEIHVTGTENLLEHLLRQHPYIESLHIEYPMPSLSELLLLEWDGEKTTSSLALKHLTLYCEFEEDDANAAESLLQAALQRRSSLCSFAQLETLTLVWFEQGDDNAVAASTISFTLAAKCLLQIGGTSFDLRMNMSYNRSWDRNHQMLQSQLKNEVIRRQEKERRKPKYVKPDV